jgi:23S rRNA (adenine2030-N6)-methyltransferase
LRRGLILIDPAYEVKAEYDTVPAAVARAVTSWPQGIYAIWYPILAEARHLGLLSSLNRALAGSDKIDAIVTEIAPPNNPREPARGMRGAGLVIINQPWRFDDEIKAAAGWLADRLWPAGPGRHTFCSLADYRGLGRS